MNKVYFVHCVDEYEGYYIGAPNRGKAKQIGCNELGCDFVDVRCAMEKGIETEITGELPRSERDRLRLGYLGEEW